ncbi:S41 family peptidase [Paenibacillus eucommiae]|uniref:Carboxyl-terminal processing protease n=1 Tax=Paenibacillus eucommiae TaxID=1355755 RepID=A0ABS4J5W0_9BACL|nr:S41 family peptidase [Paenibacillus eucommiae]MBP1995190.1 carboxyl-terminal processing protease [Paenibacillus eucommiae]
MIKQWTQWTQWTKLKWMVAVTAAIVMAFPLLATAKGSDSDTQQVRDILSQVHVSGVSESALAGKSIDEMLKLLDDPYTDYFSPEELEQFSNILENNYVGMGARVGFDENGVFIVEVFAGSPAEKAGIQRDDYIKAVDGAPTDGLALDVVVNKIKGEAGTSVEVTVERDGKFIKFPLIRDAVNIPEVYSKHFEGNVGYMQITDFSSDAELEFDQQLKELQVKGLDALIIDLRNDPGGLLSTALNISKHFIQEGTLIYMKDRNDNSTPLKITGGSKLGVPVHILLNEYSASASEVLAGALQDYGIAKVIGMQSYGKGSVQRLYGLEEGGALKVTVEEYLTPNKHEVNHVGITPDLKVDGSAAQMITALRKSGITDIKVQVSKHKVLFNGVEVIDSFNLVRENGKLFAPTRALAALINAEISWNDKLRTIDIAFQGGNHSFSAASSDILIENGTSYVNVEHFRKFFPQLVVEDQGEQLTTLTARGN